MIYRVPRRLRQLLAVMILAIVMIGAWTLLVAPVAGKVQSLGDEIATERVTIQRLRDALQSAASRGAAGGAPDHAATNAFITGESAAIRLAAFQAMLTGLFEANSVKPRSITAVPARNQDGLTLIGAEVSLQAPLDVVQRIILALETQRPILIIEQLDITAAVSDPAAPGAVPTIASPLDVRFKISAADGAAKGDPS